jgi:cephalosporin hydroxylase
VAVVLDGAHDPAHVMREIEVYSEWVTQGQFMVVEDTFKWNRGDGAPNYSMPVVQQFLDEHHDFRRIEGAEKFHATFNPGGWLVRA